MGLFGVDKLISETPKQVRSATNAAAQSTSSLMQKEVPLEDIMREQTRLFGSRSPSPTRGRRRKRTPPTRKEPTKRNQFETCRPLSRPLPVRDHDRGRCITRSANHHERLGRKGGRRRGSFERSVSSEDSAPAAKAGGASLPPVPRCAAEARALSAYYQVYHQEMGKQKPRTPSPCRIYGSPYYAPYETGNSYGSSSATDHSSSRYAERQSGSRPRFVASALRKKVYVPVPKGDDEDLYVVGETVSEAGSKPVRRLVAKRGREQGGDLIIVSSSEGELEDVGFDDR